MIDTDIKLLQIHFNEVLEKMSDSKSELYRIRKEFVDKFNLNKLNELTLEEYALGKSNYKETFCYILEFTLDPLGSMGASPSTKFGIYYGQYKGKDGTKYWFTKKFGSSEKEAFHNIKNELISLIEAGNEKNFKKIHDNKLAPNFKGKILSTYFPNDYLCIFSNDHLNHFLVQFNLDNEEILKSNVLVKRKILLDYKNQDTIMKNWSADIFSDFLYDVYPKAPNTKSNEQNLMILEFPVHQKSEEVNLQLLPLSSNQRKGADKDRDFGKLKNPDYEKLARNFKRIGNRGEKLVIEFERNKLIKCNLEELSKKVSKAKLDIEGYDINSFDETGMPIKIEVKSTTSKIGESSFFITSNEIKKARSIPEYNLYIVFEANSEKPKIWRAGNLLRHKNNKIKIEPINFKVSINLKNTMSNKIKPK